MGRFRFTGVDLSDYPRPLVLEEIDPANNQTIRWFCEPPAPGAWYVPTVSTWTGEVGATAVFEVFEWRSAFQRPQ